MQNNAMKKQSFLQGAAVLALATAIVKIIGMLYKIPLRNIIGDAGYGYFTTAYDIYSVLLMISTTGLPVAMSRMISEAQALNRPAQIQKIFRTSLFVFLTIGVLGSTSMLLFSRQLSIAATTFDTSAAAIAVLAPSVLFICVISAFRGFFQGQSNMTPTSVSQVFEAICKLVIGLAAASYLLKRTGNISLAAGGAILGVTIGCVVSMTYLAIRYRQTVKGLSAAGNPLTKSTSATMGELLAIAIPITLGAAGLQMINLVDTVVFMRRLTAAAGFGQEAAEAAKGIYNFCQTIFNLPCAFITPITISIIPAITSHLTLKNNRGAKSVSESSVRIMSLIAMPCAVGLSVLSGPVLSLFGYDGAALHTGSGILRVLGISVIFNSLVLLTNATLQAYGHVTRPVIHMLIGGVVKVLVNYVLVGVPSLNILGASIGTLCCYASITMLNLLYMRTITGHFKIKVLSNLPKPFFAAVAMGAAAYMSYDVLHTYLSSQKIACLAAIAISVAVYLVFVLALRVITREDCLLLPGGEKIAKLLKIR